MTYPIHRQICVIGPGDATPRELELAEIAAREVVALRTLERRSHAIAYAKGGEEIADLLALAGASETALRLD